MSDWKEALSHVGHMVDQESEWADIPWADWLTIRAHMEGLEAEVVKLRAWAHGPEGVQWHIQQREAAEARVRELEAKVQELDGLILQLGERDN